MLGPRDILKAIPHRYPFVMVDKIVEMSDDGTRAVGIKNLSANEPFFQGHFPGYPIMPGVLIVEALAQTAAAAMRTRTPGVKDKLAVLAGIDNFRFRRPVVPGDTLRLEVALTKMRGPVGKISGRATVDGQLVAEGDIMFAITPWPEEGIGTEG